MAERPSWIEIDLGAVGRNYSELQRLAGAGRRVIASIKANAYGHGVLDIARVLERSDVFALWTGHVPEALALRAAGIHARILMFGGYLPEAIPELLCHDLTPTIYDRAGLAAAAASGRSAAPVYVKVDAGLGRLGVPLVDARRFIGDVARTPGVRLEGVYTHLPFGNREGMNWAASSARGFERLLAELRADGIVPEITQLWGSSGLVAGLADPTSAVCVGHLLYGLLPLDASIARPIRLEPVCAGIKSRLIHVARHRPGADLAIGSRYRLAGATSVGVIPLGYGDGMLSPVKGAGPEALVGGTPAPIVGVSLEHTVLDLSRVSAPAVGDEVTLVGTSGTERITLEDCAGQFGCTPLSMMMSFSGRLASRPVAFAGTEPSAMARSTAMVGK
jgi:alanine racemase